MTRVPAKNGGGWFTGGRGLGMSLGVSMRGIDKLHHKRMPNHMPRMFGFYIGRTFIGWIHWGPKPAELEIEELVGTHA